MVFPNWVKEYSTATRFEVVTLLAINPEDSRLRRVLVSILCETHWISRTVTAVTAAGLALLLATGAAAQGPKPTVVLVHGGFTDASGWDGVIKQHDGFPVIAPANPLRGAIADSAYLASVLDTLSGPLVLVGASEGGIVISNAAAMTQNAQNVQALVFVAAFIPDVGERGADLTPKPGSLIGPALQLSHLSGCILPGRGGVVRRPCGISQGDDRRPVPEQNERHRGRPASGLVERSYRAVGVCRMAHRAVLCDRRNPGQCHWHR